MSRTTTAPTCSTRHAIILAAGESTRTRPLTLQRPKPLIPLVGKPLLAHILDQLVGLVEHVTLVVGYRADDIRAHFGENYSGIQMHYVLQTERNGTAGALLALANAAAEREGPPLDAPFFLLYGDNLISHTDLLRVCQQRYCMAALPVDDPRSFGVLDIEGDRVRRIIEKPPDAPPGSFANPGIYHFDGDVVPALRQIQPSPRGEYELTDLIGLLAQQQHVGYSVCAGYWIPIGTPWEALMASLFLLQQRAGLHPYIDPGAELDASCALVGAAHVGPGARLGPGCTLHGPVLLGEGVVIEAGCTLERCVIEAGAIIEHGSTISDSVVGAGCRIGPDCTVQYSLLDRGASLGAGIALLAHSFREVQPAAATMGLLNLETMQQRGAVVGQDVHLPSGTLIEAGSVLFPDAHTPA
jgi:bifunctional UDP-N-acetylglucosamine pyrophosphorylase/glucosamine-1-phosphate N-acetyltransferase